MENESGIILETDEVKQFRQGVLLGTWDKVFSIVPFFKILPENEQKLKFCLKEQKYLEQISEGNYKDALSTLRNEVTPLHSNSTNLHHLASLLLCNSSEELKQTTEWENDRLKILEKVQSFIPSNIMIPNARLSILIQQALSYQINNCEKHCGFYKAETLLENHTCDNFSLPKKAEQVIVETAEVWDVVFSHEGEKIAAVCKNSHFSVWNVKTTEKILEVSKEACGICWSLDDLWITTGNSDGLITTFCATTGNIQYSINEHTDKVTSCVWLSYSQLLTGGVDKKLILWDNKTKLKQWDYRVRQIEKSEDSRVVAVLNAAKNEVIVLGYSPLDKINVITEDDAVTSLQISKNGNFILIAVSLTKPVSFM